MAYIAPSLWAVNQYGEGLRGLVRRAGTSTAGSISNRTRFSRCDHLHGAAILHPKAARNRADRGGTERGNGRHRLVRRGARRALRDHAGERRMADGHRRGAGADRAAGARVPTARPSIAGRNRSGLSDQRRPRLSASTTRDRSVQCTPKGKKLRPTRSRSRTDHEATRSRPGGEALRKPRPTPICSFPTNAMRAVPCA